MFFHEFALMMIASILLSIWVLRLMWVNRGLRKELKAWKPELVPTAPAMVAQPALATEREPEMDKLRQRIQVLERIATDGNATLQREIDQLRHA